jgi:hypothetical protein
MANVSMLAYLHNTNMFRKKEKKYNFFFHKYLYGLQGGKNRKFSKMVKMGNLVKIGQL